MAEFFSRRRVRYRRRELEMPQWQLARMVGRAQSTICEYETGVIEPSPAMIHALAVALGVQPEYLTTPGPPVMNAAMTWVPK